MFTWYAARSDRSRRTPAAVGAAVLLLWVGLADSAVAAHPSATGAASSAATLRARAGEASLVRPALKGALRGALRGALQSRTQNRRRSHMRRIHTLIGAALVAAATAAAIAVSGGSAQAPGDQTLTFVERSIPAADVYADVPPLSSTVASAGDGYMFRNEVLDAAGTTKLGVHEARCSYLRATPRGIGSRLICDGVYNLRDGMISASTAFTYSDHPRISFVVTGGTGAYEGARGSGVLTYRSGKSPFADTTIRLLP